MITKLIIPYNTSLITKRMNITGISLRLLTFGGTRSRIETFGAMITSSICCGPVMIRRTRNTFDIISILLIIPEHMPGIAIITRKNNFQICITILRVLKATLQLISIFFEIPDPVIITVSTTTPATSAMNARLCINGSDIQENY
jgi:hypothetical protein